jgi:hypothetical protein
MTDNSAGSNHSSPLSQERLSEIKATEMQNQSRGALHVVVADFQAEKWHAPLFNPLMESAASSDRTAGWN